MHPSGCATRVAARSRAVPTPRRRATPPHLLRALVHRDYRLWAIADLISTVGSWMQLVAQNWIVLEVTHSPAALGTCVAVQSAPALALGMWGGSLADRLPKKQLLIATQSAFALLALVLAAATATGTLNIWVVWAVALGTGLTAAVNTPTVGAFCAEIVPAEDLGNAMALGAATSSTGRMVGMALAAWVVAAFGAQTAFAFNAVSFLAVIIALALMRGTHVAPRHHNDRSKRNDRAVGTRDGLRYILGSPKLLGLLALCFVLSAFGRNFQVTMAAMVDGPLHGGAGDYGFLSTVFAVGTLIGAIVAARRRTIDTRLLLVAAGVAAALEALSSLAPTLGSFATLMGPVAVAAVVVDTASGYLAQTRCDPAFRGRVLAAAALVSSAASAVGGPLLGWFATVLGARAPLAIGGLVALTAVIVGAACAPGSRWRLFGLPLERSLVASVGAPVGASVGAEHGR